MSRLRLAIVGLNHYHVTGWAETLMNVADIVEIVALYDPDERRSHSLAPDFHDPSLANRLPQEFRCLPFYTDLLEMVRRERLDAALLMLPNRDVPETLHTLAERGIHCFLDKPGGRTAAELAPAVQRAARLGVRIGTGLLWRYNTDIQKARALFQTGRAGQLLGVEATLVSSTVRQRNPQSFIFDAELYGGGVLHWLGVHHIDSIRFSTGHEILAVQAMIANAGGESIQVEDAAAVALQFDNGSVGMLYAGYHLPRWVTNSTVVLHGSEMSLSIGANGLTVTTAEMTIPPEAKPDVMVSSVRGYGGATGVRAIREWLAAVEGGELISDGADLVHALAVVDAAYESARTLRRIPVVTHATE